jgi:hypothetical protein
MDEDTENSNSISQSSSLRDSVSPLKLTLSQTPETMSRQLLQQALLAIEGFGLDAARMAEEAIRELPNRPRFRTEPPARRGFAVPLYLLAEVLERWHSESEYLDDNGDPREMAVTGADSIEAMLRAVGFEHLLVPSIRAMSEFGLIRPTEGGRYVPMRRDAIGIHAYNAFIALSAAVDALIVAHRNIANATTEDRWLQRTVAGVIPQSAEFEFRARLNKLSLSFLRSMDDYVVDLAKSASSDEEHVFVRIHMFASV